MGSACSTGNPKEPSTDIFLDKIIKFLVVPIIGILALICLVIPYLVEKIDCGKSNSGNSDKCWSKFSTATIVNEHDVNKFALIPHKLFPIITICETLTLLLPLLIWSWCFGQNLKNQISAVIDQSNELTEYYRMFDKGMRRTVSVGTLHRELDNFIELLLSILTDKMPSIFILYILKWIVLMFFCLLCITGQIFIHYPDFDIFKNSFNCTLETSTTKTNCNIPTTTFFRAVWFVNIAFLGLVFICTFACLIILGKGINYRSTFFYTHVPGAMDRRISESIEETFRQSYFSLLSRFCEDNTHLCVDPGLSRSLSRKYGVRDGSTPGRETIMDKHFPVLQPEQIKRLRFACEEYKSKKSKRKNKHAKTKSKVSFARGKRNPETISMISSAESAVSRLNLRPKPRRYKKKNKVQHNDQDFYLTPRLMARKMAQDLKSIKSSSKLSSPNMSQQTERSLSSINFSKITPRSSTPKLGKSPQDKNHSGLGLHTAGHYPTYTSRNRDLTPYAYRLQTLIMQANAKNSSAWKP